MYKKFPPYVKIAAILLSFTLIVFIMIEGKPILVPLVVAGFLAILITPITSWMERSGISRIPATLLSIFLLGLVFGAILYFFVTQLGAFTEDFTTVEKRIMELGEQVHIFLENHLGINFSLSIDKVRTTFFDQVSQNASMITEGLYNTASIVTVMVIIPVYLFLFIYMRYFLLEFLHKAFANQDNGRVEQVIIKIKYVLQNYVVGMSIVILILAILYFIILKILGINYALLFAVFGALFSIIPYLGPTLGAIIPIIYALLTKDSLWYPFGVFAGFYIVQLIEGNLITPKIVGEKVSMNPFMTILALFLGNFIWGIAGMILFIPGMAILKVLFDEIEPMRPYGYLLGSVEKENKKGFFAKLWEKLKSN